MQVHLKNAKGPLTTPPRQAPEMAKDLARLNNPDPRLRDIVAELTKPEWGQTRIPNEQDKVSKILLGQVPEPELSTIPREDQDYRDKAQDAAHWGMYVFREARRTQKMVAAVVATVADLEAKIPAGQSIDVIDVGSGPMAVLGAIAALASPRVRLVAIEQSSVSADTSRRCLHETLGLAGRADVIKGDALYALNTWDYPAHLKGRNFNLVISETLNSGLTEEPIVQIMSAIRPHMSPGAFTIPSTATVHAVYMKAERNTDSQDGAHSVRPESVGQHTVDFRSDSRPALAQRVTLECQVPKTPGLHILATCCAVELHDKHHLTTGDSSICRVEPYSFPNTPGAHISVQVNEKGQATNIAPAYFDHRNQKWAVGGKPIPLPANANKFTLSYVPGQYYLSAEVKV